MFHLRFGLSDHLKALRDFVFGSRRRVKKVRIFRAWFSQFPLLATLLQAAAGVDGRQKWALILPSSVRVSLVTYTAVIAVRYPELDNVQNDLVCFGNYC